MSTNNEPLRVDFNHDKNHLPLLLVIKRFQILFSFSSFSLISLYASMVTSGQEFEIYVFSFFFFELSHLFTTESYKAAVFLKQILYCVHGIFFLIDILTVYVIPLKLICHTLTKSSKCRFHENLVSHNLAQSTQTFLSFHAYDMPKIISLMKMSRKEMCDLFSSIYSIVGLKFLVLCDSFLMT